MKQFVLFLSLSFLFAQSTQAQMVVGQDTIYGNEWIQFDQNYLKVLVGEDGIYRIPAAALPSNLQAEELQLFLYGVEIPIFTSTEGSLGNNDFIEFYGKKNQSQLDQFLYKDPETEMLNPKYSLFTDTAAYYLTWEPGFNSSERISEIPNNISGQSNPLEYCWKENLTVYSGGHHKKLEGGNIEYSHFDFMQGFCSGMGINNAFPIQTKNVYENGPDATLSFRVGSNSHSHDLTINVNDNLQEQENYTGLRLVNKEFSFAASILDNDNIIAINGNNSTNGNKDRHTAAYISIKYPHTFDFDNQSSFTFQLPSINSIQYLEIENFNSGSQPILYDLTNNFRLEATVDGDLVKIALPASSEERTLVLVNAETGITEFANVQEINFTNYLETEGEFIIFSNPALFDDGNGNNWVQNYADYRASEDGGNFETIIIDVEQLYEQFAYGVNRHSLAIRNFANFIEKNWSNPSYAFIIGKGRQYLDIRKPEEFQAENLTTFFVPTFGEPGADNLLFSNNYSGVPLIPVGRLTAVSSEEVKNYYNKIIAYEDAQRNLPRTLDGRGWMKNVMHLGGGGTIDQSTIRVHLENFENIIQNNDFAGNVTSFYKTSTDATQSSQSEALLNLINDGVSIITFFGHSSATGFDFKLDTPEAYDNKDRYPLMFSFGCHSGRCHDGGNAIGETFIKAVDSGAAAYIASSGFGYISALGNFGNNFYNLVGTDMYGERIGDILKASIIPLDETTFFENISLAEQTTLQGDPALRLNPAPSPDFVVDISSVSHNPILVNTQLEKFKLDFSIHNIGKGKNDSTFLTITQKMPTGDIVELVREQVNSPGFQTEFSYDLPVLGNEAVGLNYFLIEADATNEVEELPFPDAEDNNRLLNVNGSEGYPLFIVSNDLIPTYPPNFSIVNEPNIILKATTANAFAERQNYHFEIDTTELFNSPLKIAAQMEHSGGIVKWTSGISLEDEVVYYWRVSPDSTADEGFRWHSSSFLFQSDGSNGWNQSHFYQYKKDGFNNMLLPESSRKFKYIEDIKDMRIECPPFVDFDVRPAFYINNDEVSWWNPPVKEGVYVAVLDSITVDPWEDLDNAFGDDGHGEFTFPFYTNGPVQREQLINFLEDVVPSGNYVLFYTIHKHNQTSYLPEDWAMDSTFTASGKNLFQVLESQGAQFVRNLENTGSVPYVFLYKKDDPSFNGFELVSSNEPPYINQAFGIEGIWDNGTVQSTLIGPAREWESLQWEASEFDDPFDQASVNIYGVRADGTDSLVHDRLFIFDTTLVDLDANRFPYLRLQYNSLDSILRSSPQLDYWRVLYEGLPEAALDPSSFFTFYNDTLTRGEQLRMQIAMENISNYDMDSLLVHFKINDTNNSESKITQRLQPLLNGDTLIATLNYNTRNLSPGLHHLMIDMNPENDQKEISHLNNVGLQSFIIKGDQRNPLLDVTFDGVHILDGDIVSPSPNIVLTLKDENKYLALEDTSLFKIWLHYPGDLDPRLLDFNEENLRFFPANSTNLNQKNEATIEFDPTFTLDGEYQLIVQGRDASGNQSGSLDYIINFEIITKAMISNVLNYPNPFTTSTRFVYTLTGTEPPAYFKIQILTVSGRMVREITQDEIGEMKIGTHQTDFAWDGTDQFGDRLAKGIYLYRIIAHKANGEDYEMFESGADKFFSKGFGKMVLLR